MKIIQTIFIAASLLLIAVWVLAWTPVLDVLPDAVKKFIFVFGGLLTFVVPLLVIGLILLWASWYYQRKKSENIENADG